MGSVIWEPQELMRLGVRLTPTWLGDVVQPLHPSAREKKKREKKVA